MPPESWLVLTVAAAFLLLGIAGSPLAWVALLYRRSRSERHAEQCFQDLVDQLRALSDRLDRFEASFKNHRGDEIEPAGTSRAGPIRAAATLGRVGQPRVPVSRAGSAVEPVLIAVPNLAATNHDREATLSSLSQRYAAIWSLAETGASPEVIARATGQPIGQIELILGMRRRIDGTRATIPHAPHD